MARYVDLDKIVAEIERKYNQEVQLMEKQGYTKYHQGLRDAYKCILSSLDTLEVKEVDLNEEIEKCLKRHSMLAVGKKDFTDIAKHFFELGLRSTITEEDCKLIWNIGDEIPAMLEEDFFKELLRRYKAQKGENNG